MADNGRNARIVIEWMHRITRSEGEKVTFNNACRGLKRVHGAEMLTLGSEALMFAAMVISLFVPVSAEALRTGEITPVNMIWLIIMAAAYLLMIVSFITKLLGFGLAGRDEHDFIHTCWFLLLPLVITVGIAVAGQIEPELRLDKISEAVQDLAEIMATVYAVKGIRNLARKLGDSEVHAKGKRIFFVVVLSLIVSLALTLASILLNGEAMERVSTGLEAAGYVLDVAAFFMMLVYVHRAVKMLEKR